LTNDVVRELLGLFRVGAVRTSSLTVLETGPTTFFVEQGARRVAAAQTVGLGTAGFG